MRFPLDPATFDDLPQETADELSRIVIEMVELFEKTTHHSATFLRERAELMDAGYLDMLTGPDALRWFADHLDRCWGGNT